MTEDTTAVVDFSVCLRRCVRGPGEEAPKTAWAILEELPEGRVSEFRLNGSAGSVW